MEEMNSGALRRDNLKKGFILLVGFGFLFLSFFLLESKKNLPINTSPITNKPANETTRPVFAQTNDIPTCISLTATPDRGGARLSVTFTALGSAVNGVIKSFEYAFGDGKSESKPGFESKGISESSTTHLYEKPGTYIATVAIIDVFGKYSPLTDSCKKTIVVEGSVLGR